MTNTLKHYINGSLTDGTSGRFSDVFNPATGAVTARCPLASREEVGNAVGAALAAFPGWAATTPLRRSRILNKFQDLLEAASERMAAIISSEHGKVHDDALGELTRGIEVVEFACGIPHLLKGEVTENVGTHIDSHSLRQPLGVVAGITRSTSRRWCRCGCSRSRSRAATCFILKPSERDPSASLLIAELLTQGDGHAHVGRVRCRNPLRASRCSRPRQGQARTVSARQGRAAQILNGVPAAQARLSSASRRAARPSRHDAAGFQSFPKRETRYCSSSSALQPPPSARTSATLAASRRPRMFTAVRSLLSAIVCAAITFR
jgi:hypothetical protein